MLESTGQLARLNGTTGAITLDPGLVTRAVRAAATGNPQVNVPLATQNSIVVQIPDDEIPDIEAGPTSDLAPIVTDFDLSEAEGAEPLAEWEQELLAGATASTEPGTPEADVQTEPKTTEG